MQHWEASATPIKLRAESLPLSQASKFSVVKQNDVIFSWLLFVQHTQIYTVSLEIVLAVLRICIINH